MPGESRPPFEPGNTSGALSRGGRPRKTPEMREAEELACQRSPDAMKRLVEIATASEDEHAAIKAANAVLDRAFGKPTQAITGGDGEPLIPQFDFSKVSEEDAIHLLRTLRNARSGHADDSGTGGGGGGT